VLAALLHGHLGWVTAYMLGDVAGGLAGCQRAVALLAGTSHLAELAVAYSLLGAAYMRAGRWRDQLEANRKNLAIGEQLGALELVAKANLNLGVNLAALGETAEAIACSRTALALNQRMCMTALVGLARNNLALALIDAGALAEAEAELDEAERLSGLCGGLYYRTEVAQGRTRIAARRGDLDGALAHAAAALRLGASPIDEGITRRLAGAVLSMAGRHDEAAVELAAAARALGDADLGEAARVVAELGRAALRRGDPSGEALLVDAGRRFAALGAALDAHHLRDLSWL
jgi:tetratricopeptide (TPR) repeat protein